MLFYYIAERTYLKGVIGLSTSTAKKQVISAEGLQKSTVQSSHLKAYVKKNLKRYSVHHNFLKLHCTNFRYANYVVLYFICARWKLKVYYRVY